MPTSTSSRSRAKAALKPARARPSTRLPSIAKKKTPAAAAKKRRTGAKANTAIAKTRSKPIARPKTRARVGVGRGARAIASKLSLLKRRGEKLLSKVKASVAAQDASEPKTPSAPADASRSDSATIASTSAMSG